ncbi:MAG: LptA/OstA family protein [Verrucomicrobiales bacterium]|jgi:lipopolysaccharide export system protein LptA|nr:LptA/OstA family protein [Verrucomicrobiales bacterium]
MRKFLSLSLITITLVTVPVSRAQDAVEEVESGARKILSDPRLDGLIRSAQDDPEAMVEDLRNDPEAAVRKATQIFQENKKNIDPSVIDTPENREKAKALSATALTRASELAKEKAAEAVPPPSEKEKEKVPATRSIATTSEVATPVAMPVEGGDAPIATNTDTAPVIQSTEVTPLTNSAPTETQIPDSPHLTNAEVPAPRPLAPKYDLTKENSIKPSSSGSPGDDYMEINARESIMDSKRGVLTFLGNVVVDHPDYDLKCEKLEIQLTGSVGAPSGGGSEDAAIKRAIATGGMVEIKRVGEGGKVQVALARKADYDALKQEFILSGGPPYIQDGNNYVKTNSQDSRIVMRGNGTYEILGSDAGSTGRSTIRVRVPKSNTGDVGIGGGLGSGVDQLR